MSLPAQTSLLRRIIVLVALLGVVVVTHLSLQQANGFTAGCTGLGGVDFSGGAATTGEASGCASVLESEYADLFGIPNVWLGLIFYVVVAGLRLAYAARGDGRLRQASFAVVGVGTLYTAWLVYLQAAVIGSFCPLCMTSAALVLTLLLLHVIEHRRLSSAAPEAPARRAPQRDGLAALRPYVPVFGVFAVLLVGTFGLAAQTAPPERATADPTPLATPTPRIQDVTGACEYDAEYAPIADLAPFTQGPSRGAPGADVTVVKVFDPNCPHCRSLSETLDAYIAENGETARYFYVPFPLRQQSLGQVIALERAAEEGVFFELMDEMFARQDATWGMTLDELVETVSAVGMDGPAFAALLDADDPAHDPARLQAVLAAVQADADAVAEAFAREDGGFSVPKLAVDGRVVASTYASYSARCLDEFIAEAGQPAPAAPAPTDG